MVSMFFPTRFLDLICLIGFRLCSKMVDLGTPFKIQWKPKCVPKFTIFAKLSKSCMTVCGPGGFCTRPAFPETIITSVPFGPTGVLKVTFGRGMGSFSDLSVFLCAMYYITCLSVKKKNIDKRPAVEPSVF